MMRERFALKIESVPGRDIPTVVRLRGLLKSMLRGFGFRCLEARPEQPDADQPATEPSVGDAK